MRGRARAARTWVQLVAGVLLQCAAALPHCSVCELPLVQDTCRKNLPRKVRVVCAVGMSDGSCRAVLVLCSQLQAQSLPLEGFVSGRRTREHGGMQR
jgi:hypothetical protein